MCAELKKDYKPRQEEDRENNRKKKPKVTNDLKEIGSFPEKKKKDNSRK